MNSYYSFLRLALSILTMLSTTAIAATYTVESTGDENNPADSEKTLREAILEANAYAGDDIIEFSPALDGAVIETTGSFSISDNVEIRGPQGGSLTLSLNNDSAIFHVDDGIDFSLSGIKAEKGNNNLYGNVVDACGNTSISSLEASGFGSAITACPTLSSLSIDGSRFRENTEALYIRKHSSSASTASSVQISNTLIADSGLSATSYDANINLEIYNSRITGSDADIDITGNTSSSFTNSSFYDLRDFTISVSSAGFSPSITITNSTLSGIINDASPILYVNYGDLSISHVTVTNNHISDDQDLSDEDLIILNNSSLNVGYSIISNNNHNGYGLALNDSSVTGSFSVLPSISEIGESASKSLDPLTTLYQGISVPLSPLKQDEIHPPYHLLPQGSFLIDAGGAATAGQGDIPLDEQRGSARVLGSGIDLGATEYNRGPVLNVEALAEEQADQQESLEQAGTPDADIVLDLDNFVSDPDGHLISDISLSTDASFTFDADTHVVSGTREALNSNPIQVLMEDSTGLKSLHVLNAPGQAATGGAGGGGGGGGAVAFYSLALLMLTGFARRRLRQA